MSKKTYFQILLSPDHMEFNFSVNICISKVSFALKTHIMFRATELRQRIKFGIFRKQLFCTFASTRNLLPEAVPNAARQYLRKDFFFLLANDHFWSFKEVKS